MKVQPRQQILEIWSGVIEESFDADSKRWCWGGRDGSNSISDAEQLLSLLAPATLVPSLALDEPDRTADDVVEALSDLGGSVDIPLQIIDALEAYFTQYTSSDGTPIFSGEDYFIPPPGESALPDQRALHVVDSFAVSLTLSLATLGFVRKFRASVRRESLLTQVGVLEAAASKRLSAAMVGLLRSFSINVFSPESSDGEALCRMVDQTGNRRSRIVGELRDALREVNVGLRTLTIGSATGLDEELSRSDRLFECGWSWGVIKDAPEVDTSADIGKQQAGVAAAEAYIYFTVLALDGISELFSYRTQSLQLLDEEQLRLAQALQIRWNLTQSYWSTIASFGSGRWPLENIPWQRTAGLESDYFSLLVTSVVVFDLVRTRASDADLSRVGDVLTELAQRARITRRSYEGDTGIDVHAPGIRVELAGTEVIGDGPRLSWRSTDFSPALLKRAVLVAGLLSDLQLRSQMLNLVDQIWDHLDQRRMERRRGLWDQPNQLFPTAASYDQPSWYYTKRVVDCLVQAAEMIAKPPVRSTELTRTAADLLSEANHLFDQELLRNPVTAGPAMRQKLGEIRARLDRATRIYSTRPGSAIALLQEILRDLDQLDAARDGRDGEP